MAAVVPGVDCFVDLVGLVDSVNCCLDVPETVVVSTVWVELVG